jgi:hypothetical protein
VNNQLIRAEVIKAYVGNKKNSSWEKKVMKMNDSQVLSIHMRLKREGKIK